MNSVPSVMNFYRYKVESLDILFPGEENPTKVDPITITDIALEKDYDNDYFPIIRLSLVLNQNLYYKIINNKLRVKFRLRIQKYIYNANKILQFKKDIINDVFCIFTEENTPFLGEKLLNESKKVNNIQTSTPRDLSTDYTFFIYKENELIKSKTIINSILTSASMSDAITYCLSIAGISNVLMSPLTNKNIYSQIILPPFTMLRNLRYLENAYGFYDTEALIFFDTDCNYIIDSSPSCTAWRPNEYKQTVFTIRESTNPDVFSPGCVADDKNKNYFINIIPNSIHMFNESVIADQLDGNNLLIINPSTGQVENIKSNTIQRGQGTYKLLINNYNNKYSNTALKNKKSEDSNIISVAISDFDIDALTPNKEFLFVFENSAINKKYNGSYRISRTNIIFAKQGEDFVISSSCEFKKFNK